MIAAALGVLLVLLVLAAWLGIAGAARLAAPLDRLHAVGFVNAGCGAALLVIGFLADGLGTRSLNIALLVLATLVFGAALSHATGRALLERGSAAERE